MKATLLTTALWTGACCVLAPAAGAPRIQFDQKLYDFGTTTSQVESVSGTFKFRNVGDGVLKLRPPETSCGCTTASLSPDTLQPGETGKLDFTVALGRSRTRLEKHIWVRSNDPETSRALLTIKVDYVPLYEIKPLALAPDLAFGVNETERFVTLARTDGKPLRLLRLDASKPWITTAVEPGAKAGGSTARIRIVIQRTGPPRRFNESIQVYAGDLTNIPVSTIHLYGRFLGQVSISPEALHP